MQADDVCERCGGHGRYIGLTGIIDAEDPCRSCGGTGTSSSALRIDGDVFEDVLDRNVPAGWRVEVWMHLHHGNECAHLHDETATPLREFVEYAIERSQYRWWAVRNVNKNLRNSNCNRTIRVDLEPLTAT